MQREPTAPVMGQRLSVSREREIARFLRESRLIPGVGIRLSRGPNGVLIEATAKSTTKTETDTTLVPFTVQWYPYDDDDDTKGEWQIYLPLGCASLNGLCYIPVNEKAKDEDGAEIAQWYHLDPPEDEDGTITSSGGHVCKEFTARIHMMPYTRMKASFKATETGDYARVQWIENTTYVTVDESTDSEGNATTSRGGSVMSDAEERAKKTNADTGAFALSYILDDPTETSSAVKLYVTGGSVMLGAIQWNMGEDTDVTGAESVWLKVKHDEDTFTATVEKDLNDSEAVSDDDTTYVKLYAFKDKKNIVTEDLRSHLDNLMFYTYSN